MAQQGKLDPKHLAEIDPSQPIPIASADDFRGSSPSGG